MRWNFDATIDDYLALWEDAHRRRAGQIKTRIPWWFVPLILGAFAAAGIYAVGRAAGRFDFGALVPGAINGIIGGGLGGFGLLICFLFLYRRLGSQRRELREHWRTLMESGVIPIEMGPHAVEIEAEWLTYSTPYRTIQQQLGSFEALEEQDDCFYLLRRGHPEYRLPKRAFASDAQQAEFRRLVEPRLGGGVER